MKFLLSLLITAALTAFSLLAGSDLDPRAGLIRPTTYECPSDTLYTNPYVWPPFAVVRFMEAGRFLQPRGPLTERTPGDCGLTKQFRFGHLYFVQNQPNGGYNRSQCLLWCKQGRDTMTVVFFPFDNRNVFYDSIPFRPGTYLLRTPAMTELARIKGIRQLSTVSFADYYTGNEAKLARQNAFGKLHFSTPGRCCRPAEKVPSAPDTPAQIFASLLQRTTYVRMRGLQLVPIHRVATYQRGIIGRYQADNPADSLLLAAP